ncbi:MAG: 2OG-Fe(II) oxygenase [Elainellaceae cyanobacterium]
MPDSSVTRLGSEIFLIHNVLDADTCNQLVQTAEAGTFRSAGIAVERIDDTVRSNDIIRLGGKNSLAASTNRLILSRLAIVKQFLLKEYGVQFPYAEPCSILRYQSQQFYKRHVDNILLASRFQEIEQGLPTRDISVVGYLNDDFKGGETYFDRQDVKAKPTTGAVLVFPSYFTHPHASLPIRQGVKYAFTCWLYH